MLLLGNTWLRLFLPRLHTFMFSLQVTYKYKKVMTEQFKQFRSDFWHQQHHWYTEWQFCYSMMACIYSILYFFNVVTPLVATWTRLACYTDLTLLVEAITETCPYYFSNVWSLELVCWHRCGFARCTRLEAKHIEYLKIMVNLTNVK
jgi:hypothetical protein